jgi:hypothetical protein
MMSDYAPRTIWQPLIKPQRRVKGAVIASRCEVLGVCKGIPDKCPKCPNKKMIKKNGIN